MMLARHLTQNALQSGTQLKMIGKKAFRTVESTSIDMIYLLTAIG
jgi:hypothetical protein